MGTTLLKKIVDESFERADFVILDHTLDEEDSQSTASDPGGAFDVFPTTAFESSAKIEEEGEEKPCHQETTKPMAIKSVGSTATEEKSWSK